MDDRTVATRILELGLSAHRRVSRAYARPADDEDLNELGNAALANWLEKLGGHRLIADVQPCLANGQSGFQFRLSDSGVALASDRSKLSDWLDKVLPLQPKVVQPKLDVFISYSRGDANLAEELRADFLRMHLECFMAQEDIQIATDWQDSVRDALIGSKQILFLLTPRSIRSSWVLMEAGAAWALKKPVVPAICQVGIADLPEPLRRYQARVVETTAERRALVAELVAATARASL